MKQLDASHFRLVMNPDSLSGIDTIIINTCGFINDAKQESIDTILRYADSRQSGKLSGLFVMGCLSQRYMDQLRTGIPEVDGFYGISDLASIVKRVGGKYREDLLGERMVTTPPHYAYLKIAEGCDRKCSFCSIPAIRGKHISRPMEDILSEAETLVHQGVKELIVISQDTTYYGLDLYHDRMLPELLSSLAGITGVEWVRLHYTYPDGFPLEVLDVIRDNPKICNYLDIPLQHINSRVLRSMRRGLDRKRTIDLVRRIRREIPGVAIRTTFIVGYPGETAREFNELKDFVASENFERMGVFTYSHEEDTHAFLLKDEVPASVKKKRAGELMEIQEQISLKLNAEKIGKSFRIVIDREEGDYYVGRTEHDSPEVDNEVLVRKAGQKIRIGNFYDAVITSADNFDLFAGIKV
jgi:ribosomal protein S12 methylthiotransferase